MTMYPYQKKNDLPANQTLTVGELIQILQLHDPNSLLDFNTGAARKSFDLTAEGRTIIRMIYDGGYNIDQSKSTKIEFCGFIE